MAETKTHNFTHPISGFTLKFPWNNGQRPPVEVVNDAFANMDFNGELVFDDLTNSDFLIKLGGLLLVIISCKIIYLTMIFMLKVLSFRDLKGYIQK